jgi:hypothetical protein
MTGDAADPVVARDAEVVEIDEVVAERLEWRGLAECVVGPMPVVERLVFGQDASQVGEVPDKGAVQGFGADGAVPSLLD